MQSDGDKGSEIEYQDFGLQDYLSPSAKIDLEDQHILFSLRNRMYPIEIFFSRKENIYEELCINSCKQIIDNEHLIWCEKLNIKNDLRYSHIHFNRLSLRKKKKQGKEFPCDPISVFIVIH